MPKSTSKTFASKAEFVRAQPRTMPAREVVAAGSKAGLKLTTADVYSARSADSQRKKKRAAMKTRKPSPFAPAPDDGPSVRLVKELINHDKRKPSTKEVVPSVGKLLADAEARRKLGSEVVFRDCVRRIGTDRAREILDSLDKPVEVN